MKQANEEQSIKINALSMQFTLSKINQTDLKALIEQYEQDNKRLTTWNFIWKVAIPVAFIGGILVGS